MATSLRSGPSLSEGQADLVGVKTRGSPPCERVPLEQVFAPSGCHSGSEALARREVTENRVAHGVAADGDRQ